MPTPLFLIHASGRFDMVGEHLGADVAEWQPQASIITHTEVGDLSAAQWAVIVLGWPSVRAGDVGLQADPKTWRIDAHSEVKLSDLQYRKVNGKLFPKFHALVVDLEHVTTGAPLTVVVVHMPTRNTTRRRAVWDDCAKGLVTLIESIDNPVALAADFNAGWLRPDLRALLVKAFPGLTFAWAGNEPKASISLIDGVATKGLTVADSRLLAPARSAESFHRPVLVELALPDRTPTPPLEAPVAKLPSNLPQILRDAGLKVVVHDGWESRGRPGAFAPVGVLVHHTATGKKTSDAATNNLLVRGRSDLPGPLCQLGLSRDGTVHVLAAGRANHGGKAKASGTVAAGDANSLYIGIEAFNDGVGEQWPAAQYDAYVLLAATLCAKVTGNSAETVRGHKETSVTGKIDPRFSMPDFRIKVAKRLAGPAAPTRPAPPVLNRMQMIQGLLKAIIDDPETTPVRRARCRAVAKLLPAA